MDVFYVSSIHPNDEYGLDQYSQHSRLFTLNNECVESVDGERIYNKFTYKL